MNNEKYQDLVLSFKTVNYLHALYQGRFAQLNILKLLKHPLAKEVELEKTKKCLATINEHVQSLQNGNLIVRIELGGAQSHSANEAYSLLTALKPELISMASEAKKILLDPFFFDDYNNLVFLISAYGRHIYAQENYSRFAINQSQILNLELSDVNGFQSTLEELNAYLSYLSSTVKAIKTEASPAQIAGKLAFMCRTTPGILRSQAHDIVQLVTGLSGRFGFKESGFMLLEAKAWEDAGFDAISAGYWRAFEFGVNEAYEWIGRGISDPILAAEWHTAGFTPESALPWMDVLFTPLLAIQWNNANYDPRTAAVLVNKGFELPENLPENVTEDFINDAYDTFYQQAVANNLIDSEEIEEAA